MFFKLISRGSRRNRKENGLFFGSLLVTILAFYMILSMPRQDVMLFLNQVESQAIDKLLTIIPVFYGISLLILFFLIYYASKYQLERRRHEFGVYLTLGMRRKKLFVLLLMEDLQGSLLALLIGLPSAVLLSELTGLITARLVGIGIVGHRVSFSLQAAVGTAAGFLLIKLAAFLILSGRISRQEIDSLLTEMPEGVKKQQPPFFYGVCLFTGIFCLAVSYRAAIQGIAWSGALPMGRTLLLGLFGTFVLFMGLRFPMELALRSGNHNRRLHIFQFRQIQETVVRRSGTLAVCSLLILAALCCFGAGVSIFRFYKNSESHLLDYTFTGLESEEAAASVRRTLEENHLEPYFEHLFEMRVGHIRTTDDYEHAFRMESILSAIRELPPSEAANVLLNNLGYETYPYLISLDSYNQLLTAAGMEPLTLGPKEAAVYMDREFTRDGRGRLLNYILETEPEVVLDQETIRLTGEVQTTDLVTDRSLTLSFALILPDDRFTYYTQGHYGIYLDGILAESAKEKGSLLTVISDLNQQMNRTGLSYESYLQNMGRQLFYMVAASYLTIYLAIIFLIIANTVISVQFLMSQQKSNRRYRTLIRLGAPYETLCQSARKQINWYFGIPAAVAACSSLFGVRSLFAGILSSDMRGNLSELMIASASMILGLCVVEWIYMTAVKRSSDRYLLTLTVPMREE